MARSSASHVPIGRLIARHIATPLSRMRFRKDPSWAILKIHSYVREVMAKSIPRKVFIPEPGRPKGSPGFLSPPGRPKATTAPLGGSAVRAATSVGVIFCCLHRQAYLARGLIFNNLMPFDESGDRHIRRTCLSRDLGLDRSRILKGATLPLALMRVSLWEVRLPGTKGIACYAAVRSEISRKMNC